jgi:nucleoid DNA-binding protein
MAAKKTATRKKTTTKKVTKKPTTKKTTAKKPAVKKTTAKKRPVAKKVTAKKATVKKTAAKKATAVKAPVKVTTVKGKPYTKSQVTTTISDYVGITKKQANETMDVLTTIINAHLKKGAVGQFKFNGLVNLKSVKKAARKARKGINPFTGEEIMIKAKPASRSVKASALKALKEMAS